MGKPRNPTRVVILDDLAPEDRAWLEAEADRIAADPATLVRMMIRQARVGVVARIAPAPPPMVMPILQVSGYRQDVVERAPQAPVPDADVDLLIRQQLEDAPEAASVLAPGMNGGSAVQPLGPRQTLRSAVVPGGSPA